MNITPMSFADSLRIGSVEFVSPDEIKVILEIDSPDSVALNTGTPRSFPRVNSYVLIPNEMGSLVAQVEWITVERSQFPKRRGMQDFGLIDLPFPLKKMSLNPLGKLFFDESNKFKFQRGIDVFPTIGDPVILPTDTQLKAIVESGQKNRVEIGTSPLAANAKVFIDPDRLFGRHLAVLGNTGSGKSCSVAGLIRWSLDAAAKSIAGTDKQDTNSRFIILDPNGEYSKAFEQRENTQIFSVDANDHGSLLKIPLWFWNSDEWISLTQASGRAQRPLLKQALREIRRGQESINPSDKQLKLRLNNILVILKNLAKDGAAYSGWKCLSSIEAIRVDLSNYLQQYQNYAIELNSIITKLDTLFCTYSYDKKDGSKGLNNFPSCLLDKIVSVTESVYDKVEVSSEIISHDENIPLPFDSDEFISYFEALSSKDANPTYYEYLIMRIKTMLNDVKIKSIINDESITLSTWLETYIGSHQSGHVSIIDLSLVPQEVVHIITAVITRMILEALQRYQKANKKSLPTVLVMDEAHNFVKRYNNDAENQDAASICCKVFEKVAREGRKFGLGMVLASQRPSELSPTVLSQCNSFLLHRLSNDRDQEIVHKLVPDNLKGLLRDLPNLPSKMAILLGWASELPILVQMKNLIDEHKPKSDDPDFWDVWTRKDERNVNWHEIANQWQQIPIGQENTGLGNEAE